MLTGAFYQSLSSSTSADLAGGISVDQYIGQQLKTRGYNGLVSLNQGAFVRSTGRLSWSAPGQVVLPNPDPYSVFNLYFKGALPATTSADRAQAVQEHPRRRHRRPHQILQDRRHR